LGTFASTTANPSTLNAETNTFKRSTSKPRWGIVLLVMLMSMAVFGYMYKDMLLQEAELFKKYLLRGTAAAPAPMPVASVPEPVAASSPEPVASDAPELVASSPTPANEVASAAMDIPPRVEKRESFDKEPQTNATQSDKVSDADWISKLPEEGFVLQLSAFDVEEEMLNFKRSHPAYASARVMQVRKKDTNKRYFILLAGPFETKTQADQFMKSNPLLAKGWLRSVKSVKAQLAKA
jgi:septal ring-binding cell division protein DamX